MEIQTIDNIYIITKKSNQFSEFMDSIDTNIDDIKNQNTIIDLSESVDVSTDDVALFLPLVKIFKKSNKSLVLVIHNVDFNEVDDRINVVPTMQEAFDIIEMEEIERDLGF
jgi:hypothetical protein